MTKHRTPTPVYLDPGMHPGLEVKGLISLSNVGREFHSFGAAIAKARLSNVLVNECGCLKIGELADRRARFGLCSTSSSDKYSGAFPCTTGNVTSNILYVILCCIGSQ